MNNNDLTIFILKHPFFGCITKCNDNNYGVVTLATREEVVHLRDFSGSHLETMRGLENKYCAFATGGHPYKLDSSQSIVSWELLENIQVGLTPQKYREYRDRVFNCLSKEDITKTLSAEWYVQLWRKKTGNRPKFPLKPSPFFISALQKQLVSCSDEAELISLLASIVSSPLFVVNVRTQLETWNRFYQPSKWSIDISISPQDFESLFSQSGLSSHCEKLLQEFTAQARAIAIDLESNGSEIFQFGWKTLLSSGVRKNQSGLNNHELNEALQESLLTPKYTCVIGHNLLSWDLQILRKHNAPIPKESLLWDTLITSFLLAPWKKTHALIVGENAHQADADAEACFKLFEKQILKMGSILGPFDYDTYKVIEILFQNPSVLSGIDGREYPTYQSKSFATKIFPSSRIDEIKWNKECHIKYVSPESKLSDPLLSPDICHEIANVQDDIIYKIIAIIVFDACSQGVHVLLSNLPAWIAGEKIQSVLKRAHVDYDPDYKDSSTAIYLAEDLFRVPIEEIENLWEKEEIEISYKTEVIAVWQRSCSQMLKGQIVQEQYEEASNNRYERALLPIQQDDHQFKWLLYAPPGLGEKRPAWSILPEPPDWLRLDENSKEQSNSGLNDCVAIPNWRDGHTGQLESDRLFVSPDSLNRLLYLSDVTHSILNVLKSMPEDCFLLIVMRWHSEATQIQNTLNNLSLSTNHPGSALRKLEHVNNGAHRAIVSSIEEINDYIRAAETLEIKLQILIDEVPLHQWYAFLNSPELFLLQKGKSGNVEIEQISEGDLQNGGFQVGPQVSLKGNDIILVTSLFLKGWVSSLIGKNTVNVSTILLDSRLTNNHLAKSLNVPQKSISFFSLEELLDQQQLDIYRQICFPPRKIEGVPKDYELYRSFLQENWGFDDFRQRTQKPAIEKIFQTKRDILLRLPTGEGKSIVFHLPALLHAQFSGRLTLVITPLRALMRDQVEGLWQKHFTKTVDYLSGGRDGWVNHETYQGILDGRVKLVFVAPERFRVSQFVEVLERRRQMDGGLEFIVFDEAHCISEWGFEFRPDYLYAAQFIAERFKNKNLPGNPTRLLLTSATITQRNRKDIERELELGLSGSYEDLPEEMPHPIQPYIGLESFNFDEESGEGNQKYEKIVEILSHLDLQKSAALVFVRLRKDCHTISEYLNSYATTFGSNLSSIHALPFHAGLPEVVKAEACQLLKERRANVLVCTKAFGMGMDIPHLHACIHLRPPTFIEDYLQEVGRIGRDEQERLKSNHELVTASLLYNQENIQKNLTLLHDKTVKPPDLLDFYDYCLKNAVSYENIEKTICIVPAKVELRGAEEFDEGQVTTCLFWLERMKALRIEGRMPPFLEVSFNRLSLKKCADGSTLASQIAKALLDTVDGTLSEAFNAVSATSEDAKESSFGRIVKGLLRGVFAFITPPRNADTPSACMSTETIPAADEDREIETSVSISKLMVASGGISIDELFSGLLELQNTSALSVRKTFTVKGNSVPSTESFWYLLDKALERLVQRNHQGIELLSRKKFESELRDWYESFLEENIDIENDGEEDGKLSSLISRQIDREVYRAIGTSLRILKYAGIDMKESLSEDGVIHYARYIPDSLLSQTKRFSKEIVSYLLKLQDYLSSCVEKGSTSEMATFKVLLTDLMEIMGEHIRYGDLKKLIKLVDFAGFYSFEGTSDGWVSLVTLNFQVRLEPHQPESKATSAAQEIYREMLEKYDLQILRAQAMSLLAIMPAESRKLFIDEYFSCQDATDLNSLLEKTVGNIDDEILSQTPELLELLSQVRQERFDEEINKLNEGQEAICKAPYSKTLLVNAGPGSGKTHVLMMRCAHLIHVQGIKPAQILVLAFNRAVVFEIRDRLNNLFRSLGYGSYTSRLDVSTFHSFALRHFPSINRYEEDSVGEAIHSFAKAVAADDVFSARIAGRYKAILVDEFQDMNEDFYSVVESLLKHCSGGGMVIGDDDQDILSWNRRELNKTSGEKQPLDATHYFHKFLKTHDAEQHNLRINYRSVPDVVRQANQMIETVSKKLDFQRMKDGIPLIADRSENFSKSETILSPDTYIDIARESLSRNENVALLCRSNSECRLVYEGAIKSELTSLKALEILGAEDFPLYQLRHTGAILDLCKKRKDYEFVETYVWDEILSEYEQMNFADCSKDMPYLKTLYSMVNQEVGRPRIKDVQAFMQEMRASDVERLKAKSKKKNTHSKFTIATIHKVKGLEYDTVLVMPSFESFPFESNKSVQTLDSAEEARLYYVAMTRAKNRLQMGWGPREKSWFTGTKFFSNKNATRYSLKGSPKELFVSWPAFTEQVKNNLQNYLEKEVGTGNPLSLKGKRLIHNQKTVGFLSNKVFENLGEINQIRVSNVIRYTCGAYFKENNPKYWELLDDNIKKQGWFYLVLVEEC